MFILQAEVKSWQHDQFLTGSENVPRWRGWNGGIFHIPMLGEEIQADIRCGCLDIGGGWTRILTSTTALGALPVVRPATKRLGDRQIRPKFKLTYFTRDLHSAVSSPGGTGSGASSQSGENEGGDERRSLKGAQPQPAQAKLIGLLSERLWPRSLYGCSRGRLQPRAIQRTDRSLRRSLGWAQSGPIAAGLTRSSWKRSGLAGSAAG